MNFETVIERCISVMQDKKLTNRDVAQLAKISESTVSRTLSSHGNSATTSTIRALCDALDIDPNPAAYEITPTSATTDELYLARIDDLHMTISTQGRWLRILFLVCICLVLFFLILFAVDILNPTVGWFRGV